MADRERETFGSNWGTVMTTAGVAIGLGNIWRFPYMMGLFGGAAFLVVYILVVAAFGIPALMCEWALGRRTQRGPMGAFERAGLPGGSAWGRLLLLTVFMASTYYVVILGWVLYYGCLFAFSSASAPAQQTFEQLTAGVSVQFGFVEASVILGCLALASGVKSGIERISKIVTPLFFALFVFLIIEVLSLPGAAAQIPKFLTPQWEDFTPRTVLAALGQGMFSLSLGGTFMLIYGSYMRQSDDVPKNAVWTASLDVAAAFLASLIVIPSVLAFGIDLDSGPPLLFVVMPEVFQKLAWGNLLGAVFFFSVFLVAMLSLMGAYEVLVGAFQDAWGWSRRRTLIFLAVTQSVLIFPPMLSIDYILYSDLVWGSTMQPFGAALAVVALAWCIGRTRAMEEIGRNTRLPVPAFLFYWIKYAVPAGVIVGLVYGWLG